VGDRSERILKEVIKDIDSETIKALCGVFNGGTNKHWNLKNEEATDDNEQFAYKPFQGHQIRLGHYYRHLIQTVKFIDEQPKELFKYKEKYKYIKNVRAQLSTHEQALFMYNSLSIIGDEWEQAKEKENDKLITKYNLIRNVPKYFTNLDYRKYYPNVLYEGMRENEKERKTWEEMQYE